MCFIFWLCWVFIAACRLSLILTSGGYSSLWCGGFSLRWLLLLWSTGFSSCGTAAQLLCDTWDFPRPGIEPVSLALQGRFLTTGPPGKPCLVTFLIEKQIKLLDGAFVICTVSKAVFLQEGSLNHDLLHFWALALVSWERGPETCVFNRPRGHPYTPQRWLRIHSHKPYQKQRFEALYTKK